MRTATCSHATNMWRKTLGWEDIMQAIEWDHSPPKKMRVMGFKVDVGLTTKPLLGGALVTWRQVVDVSKAASAHTNTKSSK